MQMPIQWTRPSYYQQRLMNLYSQPQDCVNTKFSNLQHIYCEVLLLILLGNKDSDFSLIYPDYCLTALDYYAFPLIFPRHCLNSFLLLVTTTFFANDNLITSFSFKYNVFPVIHLLQTLEQSVWSPNELTALNNPFNFLFINIPILMLSCVAGIYLDEVTSYIVRIYLYFSLIFHNFQYFLPLTELDRKPIVV